MAGDIAHEVGVEIPIAVVRANGGMVTVAIVNTTIALIAKHAAATCPWRSVRSARNPPANTPTALAPRNAVRAMLAAENELP